MATKFAVLEGGSAADLEARLAEFFARGQKIISVSHSSCAWVTSGAFPHRLLSVVVVYEE